MFAKHLTLLLIGALSTRLACAQDGATAGVYLIQAPAEPAAEAPILIYFHGANHDETQGMTLYPSLKKTLETKGWIYVSPRDYEMENLLTELKAKYGTRKIYLAGASAGAGFIFEEETEHPGRFAGLFLIGPALHVPTPKKGDILCPVYLVFGDQDHGNTERARTVSQALRDNGAQVTSVEIPGGHEAPYPDQSWWYQAFKFVTGEDFSK